MARKYTYKNHTMTLAQFWNKLETDGIIELSMLDGTESAQFRPRRDDELELDRRYDDDIMVRRSIYKDDDTAWTSITLPTLRRLFGVG